MISNIPPEISIGSFSLIGILTGYIWNNQAIRIKKLEEEQKKCPLPNVRIDIAVIKTKLIAIEEHLQRQNR